MSLALKGRLVRHLSYDTFKIAIVVGDSRTAHKVKVCVWSANGQTWSQPKSARIDLLEGVDLDKLSNVPRKEQAALHAIRSVADASGFVRYKGGSINIGRVLVS